MKRFKSKKLTDSARGRDCTLRLPGVCNFNPETVVFCHIPTVQMGGMGCKNHDFFGVYGCSNCHDVIDGRKNHQFDKDYLLRCIIDALCETQGIMFKEGLISG